MTARSDTYDKVTAALYELASEGLAITVKGVAQRAGVARATIYNDPDLLDLVHGFEKEQLFDDGFQAGQNSGIGSDHSDEWARGILHIAPGERLTTSLLRDKRARLSKFFHPDRGGDTELQQTLNHAFDILKGKAA
jgi:hypothetical protein